MTDPIRRTTIRGTLVLASLALMAACGGEAPLPSPRPIVNFAGLRITPEPERMQAVDDWFRPQLENIEQDPSFLISSMAQDSATYPWETLEISGDTARISYQSRAPDTGPIYQIYAHYHLMAERDELETWLPEAEGEEGFDLERAILVRVADAWLYGRSVFDAAAHPPLDEILYAREFGHLDALILTARDEEFSAEREAWIAENPEGMDDYYGWFRDTFGRPPPGWRDAS